MSSFSERMGFVKHSNIIQLKSMNETLRNGLWNFYLEFVFVNSVHSELSYKNLKYEKIKKIWHLFYKIPLDLIPYFTTDVLSYQRNWFFGIKTKWFHIYDFIEFLFEIDMVTRKPIEEGIGYLNSVLERENSAYRLINKVFVPIADQTEINEIEETLLATSNDKFSPVRDHLASALLKLSDRENPNYRNSVTESINAVESIAFILCGEKKKSLSAALKELEKQEIISLDNALKSAFSSIYGWASNEGMRHGMIKNPNIQYEDAKYMLVACSAFVNYLIAKTAN